MTWVSYICEHTVYSRWQQASMTAAGWLICWRLNVFYLPTVNSFVTENVRAETPQCTFLSYTPNRLCTQKFGHVTMMSWCNLWAEWLVLLPQARWPWGRLVNCLYMTDDEWIICKLRTFKPPAVCLLGKQVIDDAFKLLRWKFSSGEAPNTATTPTSTLNNTVYSVDTFSFLGCTIFKELK